MADFVCSIGIFWVFYHIHDKKAADTYFSLPESRKTILVTGILFCSIIVFLCIGSGVIAYDIRIKEKFDLFAALVEMALASLTLVAFNSALYMIGNDLVDGIVMIGAYSVLPMMIYLVISNFYYSYVAGSRTPDIMIVRFFSPVYMSVQLLIDTIEGNKGVFASMAGLIVTLILSLFLLKKWYIERASERAGSRSNAFYSYPLIINLYLTICLFLISTLYGVGETNIADFLKGHFFLYVLLFAVFVAAYFVYRRKMYFNYKLPAFYLFVMVLSLLFAILCRSSRGFGLSEKYEQVSGKDRIMINIWYEEADETIVDYLHEQTGEDSDYIGIYIEIGDKEMISLPDMSEKTSQIIEKYRRIGIEDFYDSGDYEGKGMSMMIRKKDSEEYYHYNLNSAMDLEDLLTLAQDKACDVYLETFDYSYRISPDGSLKISADYTK